jgi:hypothetical protein
MPCICHPASLCWWVCSVPRHTSIRSTLPLSETTVSANPSGSVQRSGTGARVHSDGFADDEAILHELANGLAGVGVGNLAGLVRVEPDLALSAADNGGRKALLRGKVDPIEQPQSALWPCVWLVSIATRMRAKRGRHSSSRLSSRSASRKGSCRCRIDCRACAMDGRLGILTFSMKLSAVVVGWCIVGRSRRSDISAHRGLA